MLSLIGELTDPHAKYSRNVNEILLGQWKSVFWFQNRDFSFFQLYYLKGQNQSAQAGVGCQSLSSFWQETNRPYLDAQFGLGYYASPPPPPPLADSDLKLSFLWNWNCFQWPLSLDVTQLQLSVWTHAQARKTGYFQHNANRKQRAP